jgi:hypothetical protein
MLIIFVQAFHHTRCIWFFKHCFLIYLFFVYLSFWLDYFKKQRKRWVQSLSGSITTLFLPTAHFVRCTQEPSLLECIFIENKPFIKLTTLFVLFYLIKSFYDENDNWCLFRIKAKDGHFEEENTKLAW